MKTTSISNRCCSTRCLTSLLLLALPNLSTVVLAASPTATNSETKQLYFLAGPRSTATTSTDSFFWEWAHHAHDDPVTSEQFGLKGYQWPRVTGPMSNDTLVGDSEYKIFNQLVLQPANDALRKEILEGIRESWEDVGYGVVVGGGSFDQVGPLAHQMQNALTAMQVVVKHLSVRPSDVTVVLNYRTPRLEQWTNVFQHFAYTSKETYEQFLCDHRGDRESDLATSMNPLGIAQVFLDEGWNVKLVDMGGVDKADRDISHVIACDVLVHSSCDEGWLLHHRGDIPHLDFVDASDFLGLTPAEMDAAENLFRYRDCAFQKHLKSHQRFGVLLKESLWHDCANWDEDVAAALSGLDDTSTMYRALLSQVQCPEGSNPLGPLESWVQMEDIFSGKILKILEREGRSWPTSTDSEQLSAFGLMQEIIICTLILLIGCTLQLLRMVYTSIKGPQSHGYAPVRMQPSSNGVEMSNVVHADLEAEYGETDGIDIIPQNARTARL